MTASGIEARAESGAMAAARTESRTGPSLSRPHADATALHVHEIGQAVAVDVGQVNTRIVEPDRGETRHGRAWRPPPLAQVLEERP